MNRQIITNSSPPSKPPNITGRHATFFLVLSLIMLIVIPTLNYYLKTIPLREAPIREMAKMKKISTNGSLIFMVIIYFIFGIPIFLFLGIDAWKKDKTTSLKCFLIVLMLFVNNAAYWYSNDQANNFRRQAFLKLAKRSQYIINAIEKYREHYNEYPENIENLIPAFIPENPYTGIPVYPYYEYSLPDKTIKDYELKVYCSYGMSFDSFFYWPQKDYPRYIYGGYTERIGDWAYVHE